MASVRAGGSHAVMGQFSNADKKIDALVILNSQNSSVVVMLMTFHLLAISFVEHASHIDYSRGCGSFVEKGR